MYMNLNSCLFCCGDWFFYDNCTLIYILKKNYVFLFFGQTHISLFQSCVTLCFVHYLPVLCDLLRHIYIFILYIYQRIDLRFCCGSVRLFLVHIVCFTDIFTSLHLNHHVHVQAPNPPGPYTQTHLRNLTAFIQSGDAYLP